MLKAAKIMCEPKITYPLLITNIFLTSQITKCYKITIRKYHIICNKSFSFALKIRILTHKLTF